MIDRPAGSHSQQEALAALGVAAERIHLDKGLTGTSRDRPGLDQALAAVRSGDTLVVAKLDRLVRPGAGHSCTALAACGDDADDGQTDDWTEASAAQLATSFERRLAHRADRAHPSFYRRKWQDF